MVASYSIFNSLITGLTIFSNALRSLGENWFIFNSNIIFYNNPKLTMLGLCLFGFLVFLAYQFFKIKTKIGSFIEKNKEKETSNKEYQLYLLFFGITIVVIEIINEIFKIRPRSLLLLICQLVFRYYSFIF